MLVQDPLSRARGARLIRTCFGSQIQELNRLVTRFYDAKLKPHGLTLAQFRTLMLIDSGTFFRASEISTESNVEKSTLSRNLKRLRGAGFIEIGPLQGRNGALLTMTAAGRAKLTAAMPAWTEAYQTASTVFGDFTHVFAAAIERAKRL